jgi:alpha-L-rhamnosidase
MSFLSFLLTVIWVIADDVSVGNLRTEYAVNALGLDVANPHFSWELKSISNRNISQTGFQIIVTKKDKKSSTESIVWDFSAKTNNSMGIEYNGTKLEPTTRYLWKVIITTNTGSEIKSEPSYFETGLLNPKITGWSKAEWLTKTINTITEYTITYDFRIVNDYSGFCFGDNNNVIIIYYGR